MNPRIENIEPLLRSTQFDVIPRNLGDQCDLNVATLLVSGLNLCDRGRDIVPDAAEEIDLPAGVEAGVIQFLTPIAEAGSSDASLEFDGARVTSKLRFAARSRDPAQRALLADPRCSDAQIEIVRHRIANQGIENRITDRQLGTGSGQREKNSHDN